jgi:hypothetical protein
MAFVAVCTCNCRDVLELNEAIDRSNDGGKQSNIYWLLQTIGQACHCRSLIN